MLIEVEFPVATLTTPRSGAPKVVIGTAMLPYEFPQLDDAEAPVAAIVGNGDNQTFRVDQEGNFLRQLWQISRSTTDAFLPGLTYDYSETPGRIWIADLRHHFEPTYRLEFGRAVTRATFERPCRLSEKKNRSLNVEIVERQIAAKAQRLGDYVFVGDRLYLKTQEPIIKVTTAGAVALGKADSWSKLMPNQCFSFSELDKAKRLAERIEGRSNVGSNFRVLIPDAFSPSFVERRTALLNRYVLNLLQSRIRSLDISEIVPLMRNIARDAELMQSVCDAITEVDAGHISLQVTATAERLMDLDGPSVFKTVINSSTASAEIVRFLRDDWDYRPVNIDSVDRNTSRKPEPSETA